MSPLRTLLALLSLATPCLAQFGLTWSRLYENEGTFDEEGRFSAVAVAPDGRVYAAAVSMPFSRPRFLRYGLNGQVLWSRLYGPTTCTYSQVLVGVAGEALFIGERSLNTSAHTLEVASVSPAGSLQWNRSFAIVANATERAVAALDATGNLLLASNSSVATHSRFAAVSPDGTLLFDHLLDLAPQASESVSALELAADGGAFLAGNAGSNGFVARVDTAGQVLWSHTLGGGFLGSVSVRALELASDGTLVSLEQELATTGTARLRWRRFDALGAALGTTELDLASALTLRGFERASDGSLWSVGESAALPARLVVTRFEPLEGLARSFSWSTPLDLTAIGRATLVPASAGQMWVTTNVWSAPAQTNRHGVALLLGPALDGPGPGEGIGLRVLFGDNFELKEIGVAALSDSGRLVVAGRSEAFTGSYFYFDPIAWIAQIDATAAPRLTCTGQADAAGCTPTLTVSGLPLTGATSGFVVSCVNASPHRSGLFFYGTNGAASSPLGGGTLCVASPVRRGPLLDSGASALACGGSMGLDWAAFASGALGGTPLPGLTQPGTVVHLQGWLREPSSSFGSLLTAALRYVVLP